MKVDFRIEQRGYDDKRLIIDMQLTRNKYDDEIFSSRYMIDISQPVELSMLREILISMEINTARHAVDRLNVMKVYEYKRTQKLEEHIRFLEKELRGIKDD